MTREKTNMVLEPHGETPQLRSDAESRLAAASKAESKTSDRSAEAVLHELQVHQIELEMQNEALRIARQNIEESRDRY